MRTRLAALTLGLYLSFVVLGCNSKPADSTASNSSDSSASPASSPSGSAAAPAGSGGSGSAMSGMKSEPRREEPKAMVVPAGTVLTVRLGQSVGSKISTAGQTFTATLASPVAVEGKTAIPAGATASGTVVDAKPLGRFKGGAVLQLRLTSITVNGTEQSVSTSSLTRTAIGQRQAYRHHGRRRRGPGRPDRRAGWRRQGRSYWRTGRGRRRHGRSGLYRQQGHCPAGRIRTQLQAGATAGSEVARSPVVNCSSAHGAKLWAELCKPQ